MTINAEKREAEWEACLAWWNCNDNSGGSSSRAPLYTRDDCEMHAKAIVTYKAQLVQERAELMQQLRKAAN